MTVQAIRVITTHGTYTCTISETDRHDFPDPQQFTAEISETISKTEKSPQDFTLKVDGIGWVGFNTNYVVAIELLEENL